MAGFIFCKKTKTKKKRLLRPGVLQRCSGLKHDTDSRGGAAGAGKRNPHVVAHRPFFHSSTTDLKGKERKKKKTNESYEHGYLL